MFSTKTLTISLTVLGFVLASCVSDKKVFSRKTELSSEATKRSSFEPRPAKAYRNTAVFDDTSVTAFYCQLDSADKQVDGATIVFLEQPKEASCRGQFIQAVLQRYEKVWVFSSNTGLPFSRALASDAQIDYLQKYLKNFKVKAQGVWSEGHATVTAARLAKKLDLQWALFHDGIYDMEMALSDEASLSLKKQLVEQFNSDDEEEIEKLSVAWDFDGLPKVTWTSFRSSASQQLKDQAISFHRSLTAAGMQARNVEIKTQAKTLNDSDRFSLWQSLNQKLK